MRESSLSLEFASPECTVSNKYIKINDLTDPSKQLGEVYLMVENVPDDPEAVNDDFEVDPGSSEVALNVLANDINVDVPINQSPLVLWYNTSAIDISSATNLTFTTPVVTTSPEHGTPSFAADTISLSTSDYAGLWTPITLAPNLTITAVGTTDQGGTVEINKTGQNLIYTPAAGFEGIETFTYSITTAAGLTDVAAVRVQVGEIVETSARPTRPTYRPATRTSWSEEIETSSTIDSRTMTDPATVLRQEETFPLSNAIRPTRSAYRAPTRSAVARPLPGVIAALSLQGERETSDRETSDVDRKPSTAGGAHSIHKISAQRFAKIAAADLAFQAITSEVLFSEVISSSDAESLALSLQDELTDPLAIDLAILL